MTPENSGGAWLLRLPDGRRTRCYITLEACRRAVGRGELYTNEEYAAMTEPRRPPPRKRPTR